MKKTLLALLIPFSLMQAFSQDKTAQIALIPAPVSLQVDPGAFVLPKVITIEAPDQSNLTQTLTNLKTHLSIPTGYSVTVSKQANPAATVRLLLLKTPDTELGAEGYRLTVTPKNIVVRANQPAGLFYGIQSLLQLLPNEIESHNKVSSINWQAPCVTITDYPRFGWRGLMFDVSRHFFTKEDVKNFIDEMVKYKYNLLHFHLTDDEGWRIQIKSLPRLTEVGAWSTRRIGNFGTFSAPTPDQPRDNVAFYTQDDIRELVQYAKYRLVYFLPEVDVPGHSMAAIVSYPELSCTEGADKYHVISGEKFMDWPGPIALVDNTLCPANEKIYPFLDKVFTEVAALFPLGYIHFG